MNQCASKLSFHLHNSKKGVRRSKSLNVSGQFANEAKPLVEDFIQLSRSAGLECITIRYGISDIDGDGKARMEPMVLGILDGFGPDVRIDWKMSSHIYGTVIRLK